MSYRDHALREFKAMGWDFEHASADDPDRWMMDGIMELLEVFSKHGHSGSSAPFAIHYFATLAAFKPLCPLTGFMDEWIEVGEGVWQNVRCSRVFRGADGRAYDIDGIVFCEKNGAQYTNRESRVYIEFPYTPKTEYRNV